MANVHGWIGVTCEVSCAAPDWSEVVPLVVFFAVFLVLLGAAFLVFVVLTPFTLAALLAAVLDFMAVDEVVKMAGRVIIFPAPGVGVVVHCQLLPFQAHA